MFYEGPLQEGISTAVGQQKLVLCFVTDGNEEAQTWENEFLQDESLHELIRGSAVALRLAAGSDEAGYLAQIFPLPQAPTIVIIKNGELKEYITPGVSKDDFLRRVQGAFNATAQPRPPVNESATPAPAPASAQHGQTETIAAAEGPSSDNVRRVLAERAARLQAQEEEAERKAKEERAKAKEKAKAEGAAANPDAARAQQQAELLKKRRQQQQEDRQRILKRIEADKTERRERAAERERQRAESQKSSEAASSIKAPESRLPSTTKVAEMTALQVRLFDGSTIRSRFKTSSPLKVVREWVDETRIDGKLPYTFKHVLTPLPNKNIDETEEEQQIGDLGLAPSATLVLIPVTKYTSAYDGQSRNVFSRLLRLILGVFTWLLSLFGERRSNRHGDTGHPTQNPGLEGDRAGVQSFQNPDRRRDQQLYNGNSVGYDI